MVSVTLLFDMHGETERAMSPRQLVHASLIPRLRNYLNLNQRLREEICCSNCLDLSFQEADIWLSFKVLPDDDTVDISERVEGAQPKAPASELALAIAHPLVAHR